MSVCEKCWQAGGGTMDGYLQEVASHGEPAHDVSVYTSRIAELEAENKKLRADNERLREL